MQSFAEFSSYWFRSLPCDLHLFSFISDQAHLFWLCWHYCLFAVCFPYNFHSSHFSTFPNLLPISCFPPSSSQSSKNNLGPARNSEPDSCDAWALHAWAAAEGAGLGDLVWPQQLQGGGSRRQRAEAPLCSLIFQGWVSGSWGKHSSMYQSLRVWAKHWQSGSAFCSSGNDWTAILVGTVLIISDRMELEIAWAKKKIIKQKCPKDAKHR